MNTRIPFRLADPHRPTIREALATEYQRMEIDGIELVNWFEVNPTVLGVNLANAETFFIAAGASSVNVRDGVPYFNFYTDEELTTKLITGSIRFYNLVEQKLL